MPIYEDRPQELKDENSYNAEEPRRLLTEAGYPNGFKTDVVAAPTGDTQLMEIMKSQLLVT